MISFKKIPELNNRAMPEQILLYKYALQLLKLYSSSQHSLEWIGENYNQVITSRQTNLKILRPNKIEVGLNALANWLYIQNDKIFFSWLNLSMN
jgi:hypothetical protein